jgi:preprotein translocase subunit YajC
MDLAASHEFFVLALAPAAAEGRQGSALVQLLPLLLIVVMFYFLVFAPMRKKQRKHADMVHNLKAGDRVITSGGIYGTVVGIADHVIQLRVADQVKIDVSKSAIAAMQHPED